MKGCPNFVAISFFLLAIVSAGCATSTPTAEPVKVDKLTVSFETEKCIFDGPKVIQQGEVIVTFNNTTKSIVNLDIRKFAEGKTWQDLMTAYNASSKAFIAPNWLSEVSFKPNIKDTSIMTYNFAPGLYAIGCGEILPGTWATYLASQLEVK